MQMASRGDLQETCRSVRKQVLCLARSVVIDIGRIIYGQAYLKHEQITRESSGTVFILESIPGYWVLATPLPCLTFKTLRRDFMGNVTTHLCSIMIRGHGSVDFGLRTDIIYILWGLENIRATSFS